MNTDSRIAADVTAELFFDPQVTMSDITANVIDGRVTLSGTADTYAAKWAAERAAFREGGVRSVHNLINVDPKLLGIPTDAEITASVREALDRNVSVPVGRVHVSVEGGKVLLSGTVEWYYQRVAAEHSAGNVYAVRSVTSEITVTPPTVSTTEISKDIKDALVRNAQVDAQHITVQVAGNQVTLSGKVRSWMERTEAVDAAWRAKGVSEVIDSITVN